MSDQMFGKCFKLIPLHILFVLRQDGDDEQV